MASMTESALDPAAAPPASSLVDHARARLAAELADLPPPGSPLLAARLRLAEGPQAISPGALTHLLRDVMRRHDMRAARDLFTALLSRIEGANARWAGRIVGRTPRLFGAAGQAVREDLLQELALALWRQLGRENGEAFELFFFRALDYARQHVASAFMVQRGYWTTETSRPTAHMVTLLLSELAPRDDGDARESPALADGRDAFRSAELADLRQMVLGLPPRERLTVVMRFWQQAPEAEIATSLGVTTRTVRNYLRHAYDMLRVEYAGAGGGA
jgi:RNA polymerase sigma factor (sigma-70 family)